MNAIDPRPALREYAGPAEAARKVGMTPKRVRTMMKNGLLNTLRVPGSRPMVDVDQLRELIRLSTCPGQPGTTW
jgi:hypothetical protein